MASAEPAAKRRRRGNDNHAAADEGPKIDLISADDVAVTFTMAEAALLGAVASTDAGRRTRSRTANVSLPVPDVPSALLAQVRDFCKGHLEMPCAPGAAERPSWVDQFDALQVSDARFQPLRLHFGLPRTAGRRERPSRTGNRAGNRAGNRVGNRVGTVGRYLVRRYTRGLVHRRLSPPIPTMPIAGRRWPTYCS